MEGVAVGCGVAVGFAVAVGGGAGVSFGVAFDGGVWARADALTRQNSASRMSEIINQRTV